MKSKKLVALSLVFLMVFSLLPLGTFAGDTSAVADEYISTAAELSSFAQKVESGDTYSEKTIALKNDIDVASNWTTISKDFAGTFNGAGYVINNLNKPLFKNITTTGVVENLGIASGSISASSDTGAIAITNKGTIQNCYNKATLNVTNALAGGIAAINNGTIQCCYNSGNITGKDAGGIAGKNFRSSGPVNNLLNCYNTGTVSGSGWVGGIAGDMRNTTATDCYIQYCYNIGSVSSTNTTRFGLLFGGISGGVITNCYSNGSGNLLGSGSTLGLTALTDCALKVDTDMKTQAFVDLLHDKQSTLIWSLDNENKNNGYPVLIAVEAMDDVAIVADEYISTAEELLNFAKNVEAGDTYAGKTVALKNNIDVASNWTTITKDFAGTFNGAGYDIKNLNNPLFNRIAITGVVENLGIQGSMDISSGDNIGTIANINYGTIQNCYNNAAVNGGSNFSGGGIAGYNYNLIQNCYNSGNITGKWVGGITERNAYAIISGTAYSGKILNCYNTGTITASNWSGGISGWSEDANCLIQYCYNMGALVGGNGKNGVGAIVGRINSGAVKNSYANGTYNLSQQGTCDASCALKTDADMKTQTFVDLLNASQTTAAWELPASGKNGGYPVLISVEASIIPDPVKVTGVTLSDSSISVKVGDYFKLSAIVAPSDATNTYVTWRSSDPSIAEVYVSGKLKALKAGTTKITATTADGSFTAECIVTVMDIAYTVITLPSDGANMQAALTSLSAKLAGESKSLADIKALKVVTEGDYWLTTEDLASVTGEWNSALFNSLVYYDLSDAKIVDDSDPSAPVYNQIPSTVIHTTTVGKDIQMPNLLYIKLSSEIESIEQRAFSNAADLRTVEFESGSKLKEIGNYSFNLCSELTQVIIPNCRTLTTIGEGAFRQCFKLSDISFISSSVKTINYQAFAYSGIKSLDFTTQLTNVTKFGNEVFMLCSSLESITLPKNDSHPIFSTGGLFAGSGVKSITIPKEIKVLGGTQMFNYCSSLSSLTFEEGSQLEKIGNEYFRHCSSIKNIDFPDSVKILGDFAIGGTAITSFDFNEQLPLINEVPNGMFADCSALSDITIREGMTMSYDSTCAFLGTAIKSITLPKSITCLPPGTFNGCKNLTNEGLHFEAGTLKIIGSAVFKDCTSLTSIPGNDKIDWQAFSKLDEFYIQQTFYGCTGLKDIKLPAGLTKIGYEMFLRCTGLALESLEGVTYVGQYAFDECQNLKIKVIPESLKYIGHGAFIKCTSMGDNGVLTLESKTPPTLDIERYVNSEMYNYSNALSETNITALAVPCDSIDEYKASAWGKTVKKASVNPSVDDFIKLEIVGYATTQTDKSTGISLTGLFDGDFVIALTNTSVENYSSTLSSLNKISTKYKIYNIKLMKENVTVQPNGTITVKIPLPEGYSGDLAVYRTESDGTLTKLTYTIADGMIIFQTDHFSLYSVVDLSAVPTATVTDSSTPKASAAAAASTNSAAKTGDNSYLALFMITGTASLMGIGIISNRRKVLKVKK